MINDFLQNINSLLKFVYRKFSLHKDGDRASNTRVKSNKFTRVYEEILGRHLGIDNVIKPTANVRGKY